MPGWAWLAIIAAAVYALHRLAKWMESRGWIYYTRSPGGADRAGNAFLELQTMLEPSKRHVLEVKRKRKVKRDRGAAPPSKPGAGHSGTEK